MPEYDTPDMPILPSDHFCLAAQLMTSTVSFYSRLLKVCHLPCEKPVPRTSTTTWV